MRSDSHKRDATAAQFVTCKKPGTGRGRNAGGRAKMSGSDNRASTTCGTMGCVRGTTAARLGSAMLSALNGMVTGRPAADCEARTEVYGHNPSKALSSEDSCASLEPPQAAASVGQATWRHMNLKRSRSGCTHIR
eukprot:3012550-Amphidinium_carterae.4